MPTIKDRGSVSSTNPFETIQTRDHELAKHEQWVTLWLVAFMLIIIVVCGVMLWMRVNA
jgi:hypothetical protein